MVSGRRRLSHIVHAEAGGSRDVSSCDSDAAPARNTRLLEGSDPADPSNGLCDRALWVRRLPWSTPHTHLEAQLLAAAPAAVSVAVAPLRGRPRGAAAGADHRGHAVLVFRSDHDARGAMDALGQPGEGGAWGRQQGRTTVVMQC